MAWGIAQVRGDERDRLLRERNLAFFGALTASLSHEINNVYTIVNELGGLLNDHMVMAERGKPPNVARLKGIAEKIAAQVQRGKGIVKQLNNLAHSVDVPVERIRVREVLERLIVACLRLASLKKATLEGDFEDGAAEIEASPFALQQAVFWCFKMALEATDKNRHIRVRLEASDPGVRIVVECADPVARTDHVESEIAYLSILMKDLGGRIECEPDAGDISSFGLYFPPAPPE
jgi:C4-dicarboxylate-specific signal transduction histidine kinase